MALLVTGQLEPLRWSLIEDAQAFNGGAHDCESTRITDASVVPSIISPLPRSPGVTVSDYREKSESHISCKRQDRRMYPDKASLFKLITYDNAHYSMSRLSN